MADQLQLRGGTTAQTATFTGALREVTVDTDKDTLVVHDNALAGGYPLLRQDLSNLPAGTIDNADINASAAIAYSKLATLTSGNVVLGSSANVATSTAVTGDVTISNTGVTAIAAGVIDNADINASAAIVDTKLATIATAGKVSNSATTAVSTNTASAIVSRDASGNFTAGTITAALTGAASSNVLKAGDTMTGDLVVPSLNGGPIAGTRNRIINGGVAVDQRNAGAAQTFTAAAALAYSVDRWYGYCTGANVTGQRVQGATVGQYRYRFTGAASVTAIGFGQRIEQINSADLASTTATLSVDLANSLLTSVTWTAFYANTADTFGTLASPTRTQIATGTFTVNSTVTRYSTNISVPAAATTGIEIVFTVGAQTSGTWTIGDVQLEPGSTATPFERRSYGQELALCQRYFYSGSVYWSGYGSSSARAGAQVWHPVEMRATPTVGSIVTTVNNGFPGTGGESVFGSNSKGFTLDKIANATILDGRWEATFTASIEL